jgi:hypothetical protein
LITLWLLEVPAAEMTEVVVEELEGFYLEILQ